MKKIIISILILYVMYVLFFVGEFQQKPEKVPRVVTNQHNTEQLITTEKKVALTFDDGPSIHTKKLLDGLKKRNVKATFFVTGENVEKYKSIITEMYQQGHCIGNHTYHHVQISCSCKTEALEEIQKTNVLLYEITGESPIYLRPPYGDCPVQISDEIDMFCVLWDVDPLDWKVQDAKTVVSHVLGTVKENDIILLHDTYETSVDAALQIVDELIKQGYDFVTVEELLFP